MEHQTEIKENTDEFANFLEDSSQVLLLRHACSEFNYVSQTLTEQNGKFYRSYFDSCTIKLILINCTADLSKFKQNAINPGMRDCKLSEKGLAECENLQEIANALNVHTVFVSPMRRTLLTAYHVFKNHPNFDSIKFIVCPLMREKLKSTCDVPCTTKDLMEEFERKFRNFDTSLIVQSKEAKELPGGLENDSHNRFISMIELVHNDLYGKYSLWLTTPYIFTCTSTFNFQL